MGFGCNSPTTLPRLEGPAFRPCSTRGRPNTDDCLDFSAAPVGHIDRCVEQQEELNRAGHFNEGCSDRDEAGIAASAGSAMDSCDASVLTPRRKRSMRRAWARPRRAAIIETLLERGYITREKKTLLATDLGRYLVALVQDQSLKSPKLTGEWEAKLREVEGGGLDPVGSWPRSSGTPVR